MKILLVDDHALFRAGLRLLLSDLDESIVFVEAASVEDVAAAPTDADLVLLDLTLRGTSGQAALERIAELMPGATVVALSGEEDPRLIRRVIEAGAAGFIPKSSTPKVMIGALKLVLAGGVYLPPDVLRAVDAPAGNGPAGRSSVDSAERDRVREALTSRQFDIVMRAVRGKSNKLIARELGLSEGTVKQHLSAAFRVLGVSNRTEAVFVTAELGLAAC